MYALYKDIGTFTNPHSKALRIILIPVT